MYGALWLLSFQVTISDKKPGRSARELAALGYTNVRDYAEGKQDWIDAGLPVEGEHKH